MIAKASIAKHPLHPMLVPFPIGLWVFSLVSDLIRLKVGTGDWDLVAWYTMAGGTAGALLAALPGLVDMIATKAGPTKRIAIYHMCINLVVVALYLVNLVWRHKTAPQMGQWILSLVAVLLLLVSGWLGGELVYVRGAGVASDKS